MMKRFAVALLFLFAACHRAPVIPPGTLVIGTETAPATLDPRFAADAVSANACGLIHAGLFRRDEKMELVPHLAESAVRRGPLEWEIRLREGLFFHDGRPVEAGDVLYTFSTIADPVSASPFKAALAPVASAEARGPRTVAVRLKGPFAPFLGGLTFGVVPRGARADGPPVGAGPFVFVSRGPGENIELAANRSYFKGAPRLSGVLFKVVPDETVRLLELKKGNLHLVANPITPAVLPWLSAQEGLRVMTAPGANVSYIGFNLRDRTLADARVRRAVAHAIDRAAIVRHLMKGLGGPVETLIPPANFYHAADVAPRPYSPETARRLLDEAGFPAPPDGGPRLKLEFKTSKNPARKKMAEVFAQNLAEAGIALEIKSLEWGSFFADIKSGNFQLYSLTWVGIYDPDILRFIFHSHSLPPEGANRGAYANPQLDRLLDAGRATDDAGERKQIYNQAQKLLAEDLPYVDLWVSANVAAMSRRLKGFTIYPDESLDSLATAWLEGE